MGISRQAWSFSLALLTVVGLGSGCESNDPGGGNGGAGGTTGADGQASGSGGSRTGESREAAGGGAGLDGGGAASGGFDAGTGTGAGGTSGGTAGGGEPIDIVNGIYASEYCSDAVPWNTEHAALEEAALDEINQHRANGANCGAQGTFKATEPLEMSPVLRCSARLHSLDMAENDYFGFAGPDGRGISERFQAAGYPQGRYSEQIGTGYLSAKALVDSWMLHDGVCANLMDPAFEECGIGLYAQEATDGGAAATLPLWTADLAGPYI